MTGDERTQTPSPRVLPLLLIGYAAFYFCRANVEPALNLLAIEHGYDNEKTGAVMAIALSAYAVGKLVLGPLADFIGGKKTLVLFLVLTGAISYTIAALDPPVRFGPTTGLVVIGVFVVLNRFVQAGGWGGLIDVVAQTYPAARRGSVMGILSTSYDIGNVVTLLGCAGLVSLGFGWRALFTINPTLVLLVAALVFLFLPAPRRTKTEKEESNEPKESLPKVLARLARQPAFWFAVVLSFMLTFVRAGFMSWTPRFLYEVSKAAGSTSAVSGSIAKSAFFGVAGMIGSVVTGRISDRFGPGRRTPVMAASLTLCCISVLVLAHGGVRDPLFATVGVGASGLFLLGPYSLLAGAVSLDVAGKRGGATAAGVIDAVGYVGASVATFVLGSVSKRLGWTAAFDVVAGVTFVALVSAAAWSRFSRRRDSHPA